MVSRTVNIDGSFAESVKTFLIGKRAIKQDLIVGKENSLP
jgi:hypothetical protein